MDFLIRKMKRKDIPQVQDVAKASWNATYEGIIPARIQENFLKAAYSNKMIKKRLKNTLIYVAEVDGKVVGFANYTPGSKDGNVELAALYLFPAYQGKGIGTALLHESMDQLGSREVHLSVEKNNEIGTTFYKAKGFEVVSEFDDDFDGHILRTVRMVLKV
ncbi:GNAT family N-acetyltransferase [Virgibacillus sp. NKC19-16]|uniref:GNAT family N-acetyltransferase n=1 Tax=Virgibacillus salidurans TaxID=2831673 RepID=UPI001F28ADD2|nr:GNAT family N-acetyltransferase [Virgibacillus sp. NKC19-16]UJL47348.1 GNAT family N-acetyltransferase [Virgibacillus sp. NKC19-16]